MNKLAWFFGIAILCLVGMVFLFVNAEKNAVSTLLQPSAEHISTSLVKQYEVDKTINFVGEGLVDGYSQTYVSKKPIVNVSHAGHSKIENREPLATVITNNAPLSIGNFVDVDLMLSEESYKSPKSIGEFVDVDLMLPEESYDTPTSIGEFIDVELMLSETSDEPPKSIGEFIDVDGSDIQGDSDAISIGEYIPVESFQ